jgi:hypothetical protein
MTDFTGESDFDLNIEELEKEELCNKICQDNKKNYIM